MRIEQFNSVTLGLHEMKGIRGGRIPWRKLYEWIDRGVKLIELVDIADRFTEGWNEVECDCK